MTVAMMETARWHAHAIFRGRSFPAVPYRTNDVLWHEARNIRQNKNHLGVLPSAFWPGENTTRGTLKRQYSLAASVPGLSSLLPVWSLMHR